MKTCSDFRNAAWQASKDCNWKLAARLLKEAVKVYPLDIQNSSLAARDYQNLLEQIRIYETQSEYKKGPQKDESLKEAKDEKKL